MSDKVVEILAVVKYRTFGVWAEAADIHGLDPNHWTPPNERRNQLAMQAAGDHRDRAQSLFRDFQASLDIEQAMASLLVDRNFALQWERQFREWGGFDNEYAEYVHGQAAGFYNVAMNRIRNLQPGAGDDGSGGALKLSQLVADGGSSGAAGGASTVLVAETAATATATATVTVAAT